MVAETMSDAVRVASIDILVNLKKSRDDDGGCGCVSQIDRGFDCHCADAVPLGLFASDLYTGSDLSMLLG